MATLLAIETASSALSVAIVNGETPLAETVIHRGNVHDEWLPSLLDSLFRYAGITPDALNAVAVSAGPGSFTGLRIGMAEAKGMALALNIPLITVPTFDAMAHRAARYLSGTTMYTFCAAFDAKREDVYAGIYEIRNGKWERIKEAFASTAEDVAGMLPKGAVLLGDGAEKIRTVKPEDFLILDPVLPATHARDVAYTGAELFAQGTIADIASCEPMYVRAFKTTTPKPLLP